MGVTNLFKLIDKYAPSAVIKRDINEFNGTPVAIDSSNMIYQYVIAIRNSGYDLTNKSGEVTSHIHGVINKSLFFLENGIKPIYIFDGKPPEMKSNILRERKARRKKAEDKIKVTFDECEKLKLFKRTVVVSYEQMDECKEILRLMGFPVIEAPEEADSQCAWLVQRNLAYGVISEDADILTFGAKKLLKNFSASKIKKIGITEVDLEMVLSELKITSDQLIDISILLGCDYNKGISGIGIKRALDIIRKFGTIEKFLEDNEARSKLTGKKKGKTYYIPDIFEYEKSREYFKNPPVKNIRRTELQWVKPDYRQLTKILVDKYNFKLTGVKNKINKLKKATEKYRQKRIGEFF